jgi:predicted AAA+ superfamily ATPase
VKSDSLKFVLREFAERPLPASKPRDLSLPTESGKVIGLSGVRRCGKTFLSSTPSSASSPAGSTGGASST